MLIRIILAVLIFFGTALTGTADSLLIQVKSATLRAEPKYWAAEVGTLSKGMTVTKLGENEGWYHVKAASGKNGYVHSSAVVDRTVLAKLTGASTSEKPSANDISLAGKGFNKTIESQYAASRPTLNFAAVNEVEHYTVASSSVRGFMRDGKLLQ